MAGKCICVCQRFNINRWLKNPVIILRGFTTNNISDLTQSLDGFLSYVKILISAALIWRMRRSECAQTQRKTDIQLQESKIILQKAISQTVLLKYRRSVQPLPFLAHSSMFPVRGGASSAPCWELQSHSCLSEAPKKEKQRRIQSARGAARLTLMFKAAGTRILCRNMSDALDLRRHLMCEIFLLLTYSDITGHLIAENIESLLSWK